MKDLWTTSREDMDSFLAFVPSELEDGFVVYAYPPDDNDERIAFYGPDARERAREYAEMKNSLASLDKPLGIAEYMDQAGQGLNGLMSEIVECYGLEAVGEAIAASQEEPK